ncbi:cyclophilin-like fold protein [Bacillus sp. FJAT-28004]|uniref:cyclophilin-like fold protein n=1 Tax=Bacillus sp. FJAT-28004 TaxID=1679165 RepID=UPI0006B5891A|nr:cyclophilin-like fold protein [Bacillus sp. FJAT-28004]
MHDSSTTAESEPIANNLSNEHSGVPDRQYQESNPYSIVQNNQNSAVENDSVEGARIKLILDNEEIIVNMYDNPTSRDFMGRLPVTLSFKEYGGFEKLSVLEEGLSREDAPSGSDPTVGDFAYYAPWKDVNIYYNDWSYSPGLTLLRKIDSGKEELAGKLVNMSDDFTITIERME